MPLPQFEPMTSAPASSSARAAPSGVTPIMVAKPFGPWSNVIDTTAGRSQTRRAAFRAASASSSAVIVSMQTPSTPASAHAAICSAKASMNSPSGRVPSGARNSPVGPTEANTAARSPAPRRAPT